MKPGKLFKIKYDENLKFDTISFHLSNDEYTKLDLDTVFLFIDCVITGKYFKITALNTDGTKGILIALEDEIQWISS